MTSRLVTINDIYSFTHPGLLTSEDRRNPSQAVAGTWEWYGQALRAHAPISSRPASGLSW